MSKTKGQTFRHRFGNETKTFWYRSRICLVENRLFRFGPDLNRNVLFRWGRFGNKLRRFGFIPVRCRNVCGMFLERLLSHLVITHLPPPLQNYLPPLPLSYYRDLSMRALPYIFPIYLCIFCVRSIDAGHIDDVVGPFVLQRSLHQSRSGSPVL
jgi:hypothetical protein